MWWTLHTAVYSPSGQHTGQRVMPPELVDVNVDGGPHENLNLQYLVCMFESPGIRVDARRYAVYLQL